jgi:uncharacterized protein (TIGR02265 family)
MKIKGVVIHSRIEFVKDNFGEDSWKKVLDSLPDEDQHLLTDLLLKAQWYPFEIGDRLDKAIVEVLGEGDNKIFEMIGAKSAKRNLLKEHKSFLTPGDPQAFMTKTPVIYKSYYDSGRREYRQTGPNSGVMTTYDAETFSVPDCLTVIGWYKEALRMCGARNVKVIEEECRALGGECCRYSLSWE